MHYVGIDLAWGLNRPSGLAVLDADGRLVHLSAQVADDAIVAALEQFTAGPCLVAFDAPLIVRNAAGNRPCEAALNRDFARFDAGAHPTNTARPEMAGTPRAARVAKALGLDVNPASRRPRRGIEVYPHPATVALFRLPRTLKYKQKPGRTLDDVRAALLTLVGHLEDLATAEPAMDVAASPAWQALADDVRAATRKSDLRRAEDQVDAVVCAYVALFADREPGRTTTYGDLDTGYIVTPTLPPGLEPGPARPAADDAGDPVRAAVARYAATRDELEGVTDRYVAMVRGLLDDAGINYLTVGGRTKTVASFAAKAARTIDGAPVYRDPLTEITDQIGVRVVTYVLSDVTAVAELLADQLAVLEDRDMAQETARAGQFGYSSRHLLVTTPEGSTDPVSGYTASVQVRTVLQHAWAEFEHDIRYKGSIPEEHAPDLDRRFTLAAGLLELADGEFDTIRERLQVAMTGPEHDDDSSDPRISPQQLAAFLAGRFIGAGWSRTDHYAWVAGLLLELDITSLEELATVLAPVDSAEISERMGYRYPPGAVRRLDDALLWVFADRYVALRGNAHRTDALQARLARMRDAAP